MTSEVTRGKKQLLEMRDMFCGMADYIEQLNSMLNQRGCNAGFNLMLNSIWQGCLHRTEH